MANSTRKTDYEQDYPQNVLVQDYQAPVLTALLQSYLKEVQRIENALFDILDQDSPSKASGFILDWWGDLVAEARKGRSDEEYRVAIVSKVQINKGSGTRNDIIRVVKSLYGGDVNFELTESPPAEAVLEVKADASGLLPEQLNAQIQAAAAAGVRLQYIYWPDEEQDLFCFSDTDSVQIDANSGFSDPTQVAGGQLVGVYDRI